MIDNLGELIKLYRLKKGLTLDQLAKLCHINDTDISKLEHNKIKKPSLSTLISLSNILEVNLIAACIENGKTFTKYKEIINSCTKLNEVQLRQVLNYINSLQ
jgi:transcriptional regulator with XRE-family HTH domain